MVERPILVRLTRVRFLSGAQHSDGSMRVAGSCYHGLMESSRYDRELVRVAVANSTSYSGALRLLGFEPHGRRHNNFVALVTAWGLPTAHFVGRRSATLRRRSYEEVLVDGRTRRESTSVLRRALIESGMAEQCVGCGIGTEYNGKHITLEIDHINENPLDNRRENLRFLCPNCHSQVGDENRAATRVGGSRLCACGQPKTARARTCKTCLYRDRLDELAANLPHREKIDWPERAVLLAMVAAEGGEATGRALGVTGAAVRKRLRKLASLSTGE